MKMDSQKPGQQHHHHREATDNSKHLFRNPPALPVRIEKALPLGAYCLR